MPNEIWDITEQDMRNLETGDEVFIGLDKDHGFWLYPQITHHVSEVLLQIDDCTKASYFYKKSGFYLLAGRTFSDIKAIRKQTKIPEGFTKYDPESRPSFKGRDIEILYEKNNKIQKWMQKYNGDIDALKSSWHSFNSDPDKSTGKRLAYKFIDTIPEGYTKYDPDVLPPEDALELEVLGHNGGSAFWNITACVIETWKDKNIIFCWKVTKRKEPKLSGELWCVVVAANFDGKPFEVFGSTKEVAIDIAKKSKKMGDKPIAIFNPFKTNGEWHEGLGLNLIQEDGE